MEKEHQKNWFKESERKKSKLLDGGCYSGSFALS